MPRLSQHSFARLVVIAWVSIVAGWFSSVFAETEVNEMTMSAQSFDKALDGKKTYNFAIVKTGEIITPEGFHVTTAKEIKAYLKKNKPDKKAAYVFWVPDKASEEIARNVVEPFADYGVTLFAVRQMESASAGSEKSPTGDKQPRNVMLVGQPNPKASSAKDPAPDLSSRPENLRPGKLPERVRYRFLPDAEVLAAADRVTAAFLSPKLLPADRDMLLKEVVLLMPGLWRNLSSLPELSGTKPMIARTPVNGKVLQLEGRILSKPEQMTITVERVRQLITEDGGAELHALTAEEMTRWWAFIGFDIEEPTFVLETKGGKYRFVITLNHDHLFALDELNALPDL